MCVCAYINTHTCACFASAGPTEFTFFVLFVWFFVIVFFGALATRACHRARQCTMLSAAEDMRGTIFKLASILT